MITRRALALLPLAFLACKREERCRTCGMKLDRASAWFTELRDGAAAASFDAPRCAFLAWRSGKVRASALFVRDYYDAKADLRDGSTLRFVVGSDVLGPMGPDLVPVAAALAGKFVQDHTATRALTADEVTIDVLSNLAAPS